MTERPANYWYKQSLGKPLFADLAWSRPENRQSKGKLLIIGGNAQALKAPSEAYAEAEKAGAGNIRIVLPDSIKKLAGPGLLDGAIFTPSTLSGSFAKSALSNFLEQAEWADGVLIAGGLGQNSETAIAIERFINQSRCQLTLAGDSLEYIKNYSAKTLVRSNLCLVASLSQTQKIIAKTRPELLITSKSPLFQVVEKLHILTQEQTYSLVVRHFDHLLAASEGQISTTPVQHPKASHVISAHTAVWWMQNPNKPFAAITNAISSLG